MDKITTIGADSLSPEDIRRKRAGTIATAFTAFLIAPFLVLTIIVTYSLVGLGKNKPKVIYAGYAIVAGLLVVSTLPFLSVQWIITLVTDTLTQIAEGQFEGVWSYILIPLKFYVFQIPLDLLIGGFCGCVYIAYRMFYRDKWEEVSFKPTPIQKMKERKNIADIQNDRNSPEEGRTLGIETHRRFPSQKKRNKNVGNNFYGEKVIQTPRESAAHTLVLGAAGSGKALDITTPILTPNGYVEMGKLTAGDDVLTPSFDSVPVESALEIQKDKPSYRFNFSDGTSITSDKDHLWVFNGDTYTSEELVQLMKKGETITFPTADKKPVEFVNANPSTDDPFLCGSLWHMRNYNIHGGSQGSYLSGEWLNRGKSLTLNAHKGTYHYEGAYNADEFNQLLNGTLEQRGELLKGILYSGASIVSLDETYQTGISFPILSYETKNREDALTLIRLATSLGIHAISSNRSVLFEGKKLDDLKFECFDIRQGYKSLLETLVETKETITLTSYQETTADVRCIKVMNEDGLFVAGDSAIPTHNTTTLLLQSRDIIKQGEGFAFIDLKGGNDVVDGLYEYCQRYGVRMHHWTLQDSYLPYEGPIENGPAFYDPITRGDPSRRKDLILSLRKWDSASDVYKKSSASYIQTLFNVIHLSPNPKEESTLNDVISLMQSPEKLMARLDLVPPDKQNSKYKETRQTVKYMMTNTNKVVKDSIKTTQETLQIFSQSIAGPWLGKDPSGKEDINLWEIANRGEVVVFSLDSSNYPELSQDIANLIIQDLKTASSEFRNNPPENRLNVFIDEFSAIESDNLVQLVNKCRDANIPVTFATQTLADMKTVSDTFADQLNGIISSFIIHRVNSQDDAEEYAGIFGKEEKMKVMHEIEHSSGILGGIGRGSATGKGRVNSEMEYIVPIEKLQEMSVGQAVYHTKATDEDGISSRTYYVTVIPEMLGDNEATKVKDAGTAERERKMEISNFRDADEGPVSWEALAEDEDEDQPVFGGETTFAKESSKAQPPQKERTDPAMHNEEYGYDTDYDASEFGSDAVGEIRYTGKTPDITKLINVDAIDPQEKSKIKSFFKKKKAQEEFKETEAYTPERVEQPVPTAHTTSSTTSSEDADVWDMAPSQPKKAETPKRDETPQKKAPVRRQSPQKPVRSQSANGLPERPSRPTGIARPMRPSAPTQARKQPTEKPTERTAPSRPSRPTPTRNGVTRAESAPMKPVPKKKSAPQRGQLPPLKKKPAQKIDTDTDGNKFSW